MTVQVMTVQEEGWATVLGRRKAGCKEATKEAAATGPAGARLKDQPAEAARPSPPRGGSETAEAVRKLVHSGLGGKPGAARLVGVLQGLQERVPGADAAAQLLAFKFACGQLRGLSGQQPKLHVAERAAALAEQLLPSLQDSQLMEEAAALCQLVGAGLPRGKREDPEAQELWLLRLQHAGNFFAVRSGCRVCVSMFAHRIVLDLHKVCAGGLAAKAIATTERLLAQLQPGAARQLSSSVVSQILASPALSASQLAWLRCVGEAGYWDLLWSNSSPALEKLLTPVTATELERFECLAGLMGCVDSAPRGALLGKSRTLVDRLSARLVELAAQHGGAASLPCLLSVLRSSGSHAPLSATMRARAPQILLSALAERATRARAAAVLASAGGDFGLDSSVGQELRKLLQEGEDSAKEVLPSLLGGLRAKVPRLAEAAAAIVQSALDWGTEDMVRQAVEELAQLDHVSEALIARVEELLGDEGRAAMLLPPLLKLTRAKRQQLAPLEPLILRAGLRSKASVSDTLLLIGELGAEGRKAGLQHPDLVGQLMELLRDASHCRGALHALLWGGLKGQAQKRLFGHCRAAVLAGAEGLAHVCGVLRWLPFEVGLRQLCDARVEAALSASGHPAAWHCLAQCVLYSGKEASTQCSQALLGSLDADCARGEDDQYGGAEADGAGWEADVLRAVGRLAEHSTQRERFLESLAPALRAGLESSEGWRRQRACRVLGHLEPATVLRHLAASVIVPLLGTAAAGPGKVSELCAPLATALVCAAGPAELEALEGFSWEKALRAACVHVESKPEAAAAARAVEAVVTAQRKLLLQSAVCDWKGLLRPLRPALARAAEELPEKQRSAVAALLQDVKAASAIFCPRCTEKPKECFRCKGKAFDVCFTCEGRGVQSRRVWCGCWSRQGGAKPDCPLCSGSGELETRQECRRCQGLGRWPCARCHGEGRPFCGQCNKLAAAAEPEQGLRIAAASAAELSQLQKLWTDRGGHGQLAEAWSLENPRLSWVYNNRRRELSQELGRDADELEGFHGSLQQNFLSIASNGFDAGRRCGQVFGAGEYFAKNPEVSRGYCRGGSYMLVCRLLLGRPSDASAGASAGAGGAGGGGDHIWVPSQKYYVISQPSQVLPLFLVRFAELRQPCPELQAALSGSLDTVAEKQQRAVPPNRPCAMSTASTDKLWIGYLQPGWSDDKLQGAVRGFLQEHLPGLRAEVQVVRGRFTQAKARLARPVSREEVLRLNEAPFQEDGAARTLTVDDAHGSPGQKCLRNVARYCRGRNLRFVDPCNCAHGPLQTERATWELQPLTLGGAKADEITSKFQASMPGARVLGIKAVQNEALLALHEHYRGYVREKNGSDPKCLELYHGTNNRILDTIYTHGLFPPSDLKASEACPVSGGKGLCTSLCNNDCEHCVERHVWCKCHMFGLGIYLADSASKSDRYVSMPAADGSCRMLVCSVVAGSVLQLSGHLRSGEAMHDVCSLRTLWDGDLAKMVEFVGAPPPLDGVENQDLLMVPGLGSASRPGRSVYNTEYVAFHPYQVMPRYEITYLR